ncbi:efflux RND transporter periplasmic adaptor subunit [Pelomonas sp. SE-A7]|uniref:efflux RND transporter periplasmic adaptor subunit n=1 Tax=Pelomonas sp. SE-A7 TaxID=3054953 RepID=UPI00259D2B7B|nr:efflux RND transporter periplasmic adaptor subunit [Pelomonas sp. SE-A7]MDM4764480.1 efflux RND transporter periplasmic adaptor subunit [Pelomonas sp. SE-A7]
MRISRDHRDEDGGPPRWLIGVVVGLVVLAAAGGAAWYFMKAKPLPVQTATAVPRSSNTAGNAVLQATGYIVAQRQATVSTQITGTLTQVLIAEGDRVSKGQVLARLEDSGLRAALNVAQANARSAQATVAQVRAQLAQAEADLRRANELAASGMSSRQSQEQARTGVATLQAQLEAAQRAVEAAAAQVAQTQVTFDYTVVRAPFSGVVTVKAAQVGEIVSPLSAGGGFTRTGVGTIVDMDSLEVSVDVNEAYISQVKAGMACEAVLDAYPDWRIPAHVIAVIPTADRGKATVKVRVALEQKDGRVVPDMGVRVSFLAEKAAPTAAPLPGVLIPREALSNGGKLFVVGSEGKVEQRLVKTGPEVNKQAWVTEGLKAGDKVVVSPPVELKDGAAVVETAKEAK